ncbi:Flagellar motor rotation protein MotB [hydrothermal vent metagenome]|uniref:Flagellar motor rotation protein MotB n=1 Tax=hydrothermal vent metagenome TaxID=652676 RepID=A0A3B1A2A4_9ZZZZ
MRKQINSRRVRTLEQSENVDRWLVSYADFVTLLFAFFVVMYAISSVNEGKYRVLSDTLVAAFKVPPKANKPVQIGKPLEETNPEQKVIGVPKPIRVEQPKVEDQRLKMARIADRVRASLSPLIDKNFIKVTHTRLWVEIEINTSILYSSGSSELEIEAYTPLKKLSEVLKKLPNYIDVEGYTDNLPINTPVYPSNWELSASRAASVVHLFAKQGVSPDRLAAIGYGQFRPIGDNNTLKGRRQNRRVKVVILADKNSRRAAEIENTVESNAVSDSP